MSCHIPSNRWPMNFAMSPTCQMQMFLDHNMTPSLHTNKPPSDVWLWVYVSIMGGSLLLSRYSAAVQCLEWLASIHESLFAFSDSNINAKTHIMQFQHLSSAYTCFHENCTFTSRSARLRVLRCVATAVCNALLFQKCKITARSLASLLGLPQCYPALALCMSN
jgi:hypothetical protein